MVSQESPDFAYWNRITEDASVRAFREDKPLDDQPLLSVETNPDLAISMDLSLFIKMYPERFLNLIEILEPEYQELMIEHFILLKPQVWLARMHGTTQAQIWKEVDLCKETIGAAILFGGPPTRADIKRILAAYGLERFNGQSFSEMLVDFASHKDYKKLLEDNHHIDLRELKSHFLNTIEILTGSADIKERALGSYVRSITYRISLKGPGVSESRKQKLEKLSNLKFVDAAILGQYKISLDDPDFSKLFTSEGKPN